MDIELFIASVLFLISSLNKFTKFDEFIIDLIFSLFNFRLNIKFCNCVLFLIIFATVFFIALVIFAGKTVPFSMKFLIRFNESFNISFTWSTFVLFIASINWLILVVFKSPLKYFFWVSIMDLISVVLFWINILIVDKLSPWPNLSVNKLVKFSNPSNKTFIIGIFKSIIFSFNSSNLLENTFAKFVILINISVLYFISVTIFWIVFLGFE